MIGIQTKIAFAKSWIPEPRSYDATWASCMSNMSNIVYCDVETKNQTMELWNRGTMELWNRGTVEPWNYGTVEPWNRGTVELWNQTIELWNQIMDSMNNGAVE